LQPHPTILAWAPEALWQQVDLRTRHRDLGTKLAVLAKSDAVEFSLRLWRPRCPLGRCDLSDLGAASERAWDASSELRANGERASGQ
jgi:hypothetical protein